MNGWAPGWYPEEGSRIERRWDGFKWTDDRRLNGRPVVRSKDKVSFSGALWRGTDKVRWLGLYWGTLAPEAELTVGVISLVLFLPIFIFSLFFDPVMALLHGVFVTMGIYAVINASFGFWIRRARHN